MFPLKAPPIGVVLSSLQVPPASTVPVNSVNKSNDVLLNAGSFSQNGDGLFAVPVFGNGFIIILTTTSTSSHIPIGSMLKVKLYVSAIKLDKSILSGFATVVDVLLFVHIPVPFSPFIKVYKSKFVGAVPSQNSTAVFAVPDSGAGSIVMEIVSSSEQVPLSTV